MASHDAFADELVAQLAEACALRDAAVAAWDADAAELARDRIQDLMALAERNDLAVPRSLAEVAPRPHSPS
jgi:hypothetical protein